MLQRVFSRLYGTAVLGFNAMRLRGVPYLPLEVLHELRDRRVRWMVKYAAETVPFYRELFRDRGINPDDIQTVDDLKRLPLLDRTTVRRQPQRFVSQSRWGQTALPFHTTGSTGTPFTAYYDPYSLLLASAAAQRERDVLTRGFGLSPAYRSVAIMSPGGASERTAAALAGMRFVPIGPDRRKVSVLKPVEEVIAEINQHRPHVLEGYGSYLELLYRIVTVRGIRMHKPALVVYNNDNMTTSGRDLIEKEVGIPVLSRYMSMEAFRIGYMCEERRGFHLHTDLTHLDIVNADGDSCALGQAGEVVICNLANRGTVLLNYRLGDVGVLSAERCPCGRNLPLLSQLVGRTQDIIHLADGVLLHPSATTPIFRSAMHQQSGLLQYQLIQQDWDLYELRLATADRDTFDRLAAQYVPQLRQLLGSSASVKVVFYPGQLPRGPGGKFRRVVSLLRQKEVL
jgi:phenylacetate-CoA ligase